MRQKINKSNYEEFMIDHLDGTLSVEREAELLFFLEAHPELKEELDGLDEIELQQDYPTFEFREGLKKSILDSGNVNAENFEEFCIAFYEGDLSKVEENHLHNFVHDHPSMLYDFELFAQLKLSDKQLLQFPYKTQLQEFASSTAEPVSQDNYLDFLIARNEGDLSAERAEELSLFLASYPQYEQEAQAVAHLKLHADNQIVFENKSILKHPVMLMPITNKWMNVAAASVAILMVFYSLNPQHSIKADMPSARIELPNNRLSNTSNKAIEKDIVSQPDLKSETIETPANEVLKKTKSVAKKVVQQSRSQLRLASVSTISCKGLTVDANLDIAAAKYPVDIIAQPSVQLQDASVERSIELKGYAGKAVSRLSRLIGKTDRLKKEGFNTQLRTIAGIAVDGFNKMTEGNIQLPGNKHALDQPEEE